jgi:putative transposase
MARHENSFSTVCKNFERPNDEAALKLLYLAIKNAGLRWRRGIEWTAAMGQFAIQFGDRFPGAARWPWKKTNRSRKPLTQNS